MVIKQALMVALSPHLRQNRQPCSAVRALKPCVVHIEKHVRQNPAHSSRYLIDKCAKRLEKPHSVDDFESSSFITLAQMHVHRNKEQSCTAKSKFLWTRSPMFQQGRDNKGA
eukprot:577003-Pelagomonas_calceolata.AAC.5